MSELIVKFDDKIVVGLNETYVVANVSDYDHYIFVNVEPVDNFTPDIITKFAFKKISYLCWCKFTRIKYSHKQHR